MSNNDVKVQITRIYKYEPLVEQFHIEISEIHSSLLFGKGRRNEKIYLNVNGIYIAFVYEKIIDNKESYRVYALTKNDATLAWCMIYYGMFASVTYIDKR